MLRRILATVLLVGTATIVPGAAGASTTNGSVTAQAMMTNHDCEYAFTSLGEAINGEILNPGDWSFTEQVADAITDLQVCVNDQFRLNIMLSNLIHP